MYSRTIGPFPLLELWQQVERTLCPHFTADQLRAEIARGKSCGKSSLALFQALGCHRCRFLAELMLAQDAAQSTEHHL